MASDGGRKKRSVHPAIKALGGASGGIMEATFCQPIDVIKTRLQLDKTGRYKGILNCGMTVAREEGVRALWKGLTPFATHLTLKYFLRFGTNAVFENAMRDSEGQLTHGRRLLAGLGAGVTEALVIVTPFEVVKIALQKQEGTDKQKLQYKGPIDAAARIVQREGVLGLWKGATPTMCRNGTNQMCLFFTKPLVDKHLWRKDEGVGKPLMWWQSMISGFAAGCVGPCATGPFDVAKTRLMAQEKAVLKGGGDVKYKGFFHALVTIPREEGIRALWKGLLPRLMRIPVGQAIVWTVRDAVVSHFEK
eukprot:evm.model.scf_101EXC.6 EVM.evm.TU.scf_101EXC.6   scf_101EXC:50262-56254(+)